MMDIETVVRDGRIIITCMGCIGGTHQIKFYRAKNKLAKFVCKYCNNSRQMYLAEYLDIVGEKIRASKVRQFEKTLAVKQQADNSTMEVNR